MTVKIGLHVLLLLALAYGAWAALTELELINLARSTDELRRDEPVTFKAPDGEHNFKNRAIMRVYQAEGERLARFPWAERLSETEAVVLLAAACGYAGGLLRVIFDSIMGAGAKYYVPWVGLALAVVFVAIGKAGEHLMMEGALHFKPGAVVTTCLLAGIGWEFAWQGILKIAHKSGD